MKKLKFKLEGKEMLSKEQMKNVTGGDCGCGSLYNCGAIRSFDCCINGLRVNTLGTTAPTTCNEAARFCYLTNWDSVAHARGMVEICGLYPGDTGYGGYY